MRDLESVPPICGEDHQLKGVVTNRDVAVRCVAEGLGPASTPVTELADVKPETMGADDSIDEALRTMIEHGVRRLPVIEGTVWLGSCARSTLPARPGHSRPESSWRRSRSAEPVHH